MNTKVLFALIIVLTVTIFGYSQYSSAKHEEQLAAMRAESAKVQAETARLESEQKEAERQRITSQTPLNQGIQTVSTTTTSASIVASKEVEVKLTNYEEVDKAKLQDIKVRWESTRTLANSTARIALAPIVRDLQAERQELEKLNVTKCLTPAKDKLLTAMKINEEGFLAFMNDADLGKLVAQIKVKDMQKNIDDYTRISSMCN